MSSWAVTLKVTRALFAPFFALTVLLVAPEIVGGVVSNSYPETFSVPVQVSVPAVCAPSVRVRVPLPVAPRYVPAPPVIVNTTAELWFAISDAGELVFYERQPRMWSEMVRRQAEKELRRTAVRPTPEWQKRTP